MIWTAWLIFAIFSCVWSTGLPGLEERIRYYEALQELDFDAVEQDIATLMRTSDPSFPADGGSYAGLFVRLAWHCAGTYRLSDGEGGCDGARQRFWPEQSWADNVNLDKARRLLEPIKLKYGRGLSYGDLYILAGTVAIQESSGKTLGFCAGRIDDVSGEDSLIFGPSDIHARSSNCVAGDGNCTAPMGATNMELIYVDAAGFEGQGIPANTVAPIRDTFARMGMNDSETAVLIGGGHSLGKAHGGCASGPGPSPREDPQNPWPSCSDGSTYTSGFEGPWTITPDTVNNAFFSGLQDNTWSPSTSPGGKPQFENEGGTLTMLVTDMALLEDDSYRDLVSQYASNNELFLDHFAAAWYKLTTRDMGPRKRCFGNKTPSNQEFQGEELGYNNLEVAAFRIKDFDFYSLRDLAIFELTYGTVDVGYVSEMAYLCAATYRASDYSGGCNGARIRLEPERNWPDRIGTSEKITEWREKFNTEEKDWLSIADTIVLAGTAAIRVSLPGVAGDLKFCPGRTDASVPAQTNPTFEYADKRFQLQREARLLGQGLEGFVALMARPRSEAYYENMGYTGVYDNSSTAISSKYFQLILFETWTTTGVEGPLGLEYTNAGETSYITARDLTLSQDPEMRSIALEFAINEEKLSQTFIAAWEGLMNADRFDGPVNNECQTKFKSLILSPASRLTYSIMGIVVIRLLSLI